MIKVCYPFFRQDMSNSMGGSYESIFQLIRNLPDNFEDQLVFSGEGIASGRAKRYDLKYEILKPTDTMRTFSGAEIIQKLNVSLEYIKYIYKSAKFLTSTSPDIVHINDLQTLNIWGPAAMVNKIPVVWHFRGEYMKELSILLRSPLIDHMISVSKSNFKYLSKFTRLLADHTIIYNGVDCDLFSPAVEDDVKRMWSSPKPLIGFVGDLVPRKRPTLFIESAIEMLDRGFNGDFILAGRDPNDQWSEMNKLVLDSGYSNEIQYIGFRDDVPTLMADLTLLMLTSARHGEAFPRSPIEAMACGTPVVTTDSAGVSESVIDGKTGSVVSSNASSGEIASAAMDIIDSGNYPQYAQNARNNILSNFSIKNCVSKTTSVYKNIL